MSIVRVGLSQTQKFAEGYSAIFGKRSQPAVQKAKPAKPAKKKAAKRKSR